MKEFIGRPLGHVMSTCPRLSILSVTVWVAVLCVAAGPSAAVDWKESKDKHFIVYHVSKDKPFAGKVLKKSEGYYMSIPKKLGITRFSRFWTWDKRVKIYIYTDRATFLNETRTPAWARALADYRKKEIKSYKGHAGTPFVDGPLPHELSHLVLRDFVGLTTRVPLWLDEGVAQMMEAGKATTAKMYVRELVNTDNFMSVGTLTKLNIYRVRDKQLVDMFYMEACCLVNFLVDEFGSDKFYRLCRAIRDGKSLENALRKAYAGSIRSVDELNEKWKKHLK